MPEKKKNTFIRVLIVLPYLLILYILQSMVFTRIPILGVKPLILPLAVTGTALFDGRVSGGVMGILAGMLCDMSFNEPTILFTLTLAFLGLIIGYLSETVLVRGFPSYIFVSLVSLAVCSFIQMFHLLFVDNAPVLALLDTGIRQTLGSLIFALPLYYLTRFVSRVL